MHREANGHAHRRCTHSPLLGATMCRHMHGAVPPRNELTGLDHASRCVEYVRNARRPARIMYIRVAACTAYNVRPYATSMAYDTLKHVFSFKSHIHREHTTWALTITPHPRRSAGALSADLQALVIQVLHVPDTPRPVRSRVRHAHARPTFGQ
eukprot:COSAG02_NODE_653_length_18827_cov_44.237826_7_plen_153_part_00